MSYSAVAKMAEDVDLINRVAACAAVEGVAKPVGWVSPLSWEFAAQPGWAVGYQAAQSVDAERPGLVDAGGITDAMILAAVQKLLAEQEAAAEIEGSES